MDTKLTIVDQTTGEIIEPEIAEGTSQFLQLLEEMNVSDPRYLLQDRILTSKIPEEEQIEVMDLYSVEPLGFSDVTNRTLWVYGCAIYEHEEGLKPDGTPFPRYFQGRILVDLDGELRIVKTSGLSLLRHLAFMARAHGWFRFKEPVQYKFIWKGAGQPHIMERVGKSTKWIMPKSQRKEQENATK